MQGHARSLATSNCDRLLVHEAFELVQFVVLLELLHEHLIRYLANWLVGSLGLLVHLLAHLLEHLGYSVSGVTVPGFLMLLGGQGVVRFLTAVIIIPIVRGPISFGKAWGRLKRRKCGMNRGVQPAGEEELPRRVIHPGHARYETHLCRCLVSLLGRKSTRSGWRATSTASITSWVNKRTQLLEPWCRHLWLFFVRR